MISPNELRGIVAAAEDGAALATVVSVVGSSDRRPGARLLVREDGRVVGGVSGGGLEAEVVRQARLALLENRPTLLRYDNGDDEERGPGCGGEIEILIEPLALARARYHIDCLREVLSTRRPVVVAVRYRGGEAGALAEREAWPLAAALARTREKRQSQTVALALKDERSSLLLDYLRPLPRLLVVGAGSDVEPLVRCAHVLGYEVLVVDERPGYLSRRRLPERVGRAVGIDEWEIDAHTACVVATHNLAYDARALRQLLQTPAGYIGVVGTRQRTQRLLDGVPGGPQLFSPAGLDLGGATPEQVALAILAEIEAVQNERPGGHLREGAWSMGLIEGEVQHV